MTSDPSWNVDTYTIYSSVMDQQADFFSPAKAWEFLSIFQTSRMVKVFFTLVLDNLCKFTIWVTLKLRGYQFIPTGKIHKLLKDYDSDDITSSVYCPNIWAILHFLTKNMCYCGRKRV